jgi:hypothetical protein
VVVIMMIGTRHKRRSLVSEISPPHLTRAKTKEFLLLQRHKGRHALFQFPLDSRPLFAFIIEKRCKQKLQTLIDRWRVIDTSNYPGDSQK